MFSSYLTSFLKLCPLLWKWITNNQSWELTIYLDQNWGRGRLIKKLSDYFLSEMGNVVRKTNMKTRLTTTKCVKNKRHLPSYYPLRPCHGNQTLMRSSRSVDWGLFPLHWLELRQWSSRPCVAHQSGAATSETWCFLFWPPEEVRCWWIYEGTNKSETQMNLYLDGSTRNTDIPVVS